MNKEESVNSAVSTPRKRGRPAILKEYSDPMKSPMAQSSLQMQKSQQSFNKPLMRVGNSPTKFKTPQRKRRGSLTDASPSSATGSTKKGRYRGVVMNSSPTASIQSKSPGTRPKSMGDGDFASLRDTENNDNSNENIDYHDARSIGNPSSSAPGTPLDNVFSSVSRSHNVKSSPPVIFDSESPIQTKRKLAVEMRETSKLENSNQSISKRWKFMLNVGKYGKACIETNSISLVEDSEGTTSPSNKLQPPKHLLETPVKATDVDESGVARFDKKRVMGFLRQMKAKNKTLDDKPLPDQSKRFTIPSSPAGPPNSSGNLAEPLTPKCSQLMQFRTGLTPNFIIDELLVSPKFQGSSNNKNLFRSPNQYVFKVSSGDPLLLNDHHEADLMNSHTQEVSDILSFLNSPKRGLNLNTPPSYLINFNSPKSNNRPMACANSMKLQLPSLNSPKTEQLQHTLLPSTPLLKLDTSTATAQFTPILQKQINDETKSSIAGSVHPINLRKNQNKKLEANDDARMALKRLINGN